jgi:cyclin B
LSEKDIIKFQAFSIEKEKSFDFGEDNLVRRIFLNKKRVSSKIKLNKPNNNNILNCYNKNISYINNNIDCINNDNINLAKNSNHILIQDDNFENCQSSLDNDNESKSIKVPEFPINKNKFNTISIGNNNDNKYLNKNKNKQLKGKYNNCSDSINNNNQKLNKNDNYLHYEFQENNNINNKNSNFNTISFVVNTKNSKFNNINNNNNFNYNTEKDYNNNNDNDNDYNNNYLIESENYNGNANDSGNYIKSNQNFINYNKGNSTSIINEGRFNENNDNNNHNNNNLTNSIKENIIINKNIEEIPLNIKPELVREYIDDILLEMKNTQYENHPSPKYLSNQNDINQKMRGILIDWLVEVHLKVNLLPETLFISVNLIDRYLSINIIPRSKLQLVGVSSLLIACKYEEIYPPELSDFAQMTDNAYSKNEILLMEASILNSLMFNVTNFSSLRCLEIYQCYLNMNEQIIMFSKYLLELILTEYKMLKYNSNLQAAASIYISLKIFNSDILDYLLERSEFLEEELKFCCKDICSILDSLETSMFQNVKVKYSHPRFLEVGKIKLI